MGRTARAVLICLLYVMHVASKSELKDEVREPYLLKTDLSCSNGNKNPTVERTVTKLGEICNWQLTVSNAFRQSTVPTTQLSQGYYVVTVGLSTSGSILLTHKLVKNNKEELIDIFAKYNLTLTKGSGSSSNIIPAPGKTIDIDINTLNFSSALLPCGIALLGVTIEYVNTTLSSSTNPEIKYMPLNLKCEEEANDLAVELFPTANVTIDYGKPLSQQIKDFRVVVKNKGRTTLLPRTGLSELQVWAYLRRDTSIKFLKRHFNKTEELEDMYLNLHDVILHEGNRLVDTNNGRNSPAISKDGILKLKVDELILKEPTVCGNATLIVMVDPIMAINDKNRKNNVATLPVYVNCPNGDTYYKHNHCSVISDDLNAGKRAVISFVQYSGMNYYNNSKRFYNIHPYMKDYIYKDDTRGFIPMKDQKDTEKIIAKLNQLLEADTDRMKKTGRCGKFGQQILHALKNSSKEETLLWMEYQWLTGFRSFWNKLQDRIDTKETWQREEHKKIALIVDLAADIIDVAANKDGLVRDFIDWGLRSTIKLMTDMPFKRQYNRHINDSDEGEDDISSGLTALLTTKELHIPGAPLSIRKGIPLFFKKLLWDHNMNEAQKMSELPFATLKKLRHVIEMALNEEMPTIFNFPRQFREKLRRANIVEKIILPRLVVPLTADTILKVLDSFLNVTKQYFGKLDELPDQIQLINTTIIALKQNQSLLNGFVNIIKTIQAAFIMDESWMIISGTEGEFPSEDKVCRMYIGSYLWKKLKINSLPDNTVLDSLDIETSSVGTWPTFWKSESDGIWRGDYSKLTGKFYWTKVAMCTCEHKCPQSYHRG